jgi:predicted secreted protein
MYFDGSGDYVFVPASSFLDISSSDITIEGYFYTTSTSVKQGVWEFYSDDSNYARLFFEGGNGNVLRLTLNSAGTLRLNATGTTTLSINTWYHIAVTRDHSSGAWKTYIGGVQDTGASGTESAAVDTSLWNFEIGRDLAGTDRYWAGYIQDFRFTKGLARYTANFTPPILSLKG